MRRSQQLACTTLILTLASIPLALTGCQKSCRAGSVLIDGECVSRQSISVQMAGADAGQTASTNGDTTGDPKLTTGTNQAGTGGPTSTTPPARQQNAGGGATANQATTPSGGSAGAQGNSASPANNTPAGSNNSGSSQSSNTSTSPDAGSPNASMSVDPASNCTPAPEDCDGQDNDCDMRVDEDVEPMPCGDNKGICKPGVLQCLNGQWDTVCQGAVEPQQEVCDAEKQDEDCDGIPNNGCDCTDGEVMDCGVGPYTCKKGKITCTNGQPSACEGEVKGSAEKCDGEDNDCDGTVDNGGARLCGGSTPVCDARNGCVACKTSSDCRPSAAESCTTTVCNTTSHQCEPQSGRDGTACDQGKGKCRSGTCEKTPVCGDGTVDNGEECDDGNTSNDDSCIKCQRARCGDGFVNRVGGEGCELNARSDGSDGLSNGTIYDEWNCNSSCQRLYYYTPCTSVGNCGGEGVCSKSHCVPSGGCTQNNAQCSFPIMGRVGMCLLGGCFPRCESVGCPTGATCSTVNSSTGEVKVCM